VSRTQTVQQALLNHNAKVYIAARNAQRAEEAIKDLKAETGKDAHFIKLDLADLKSIKAAAEDYTRYDPFFNCPRCVRRDSSSKATRRSSMFCSILVESCYPPVEQITADGYDLQFGTNVLGLFRTFFPCDSP
jgi:retinol dehydrogenase-12